MIRGKEILLILNGYTYVGGCTNAKISNGCETIEISSPSSPNFKEFIAGRQEWSIVADWLVSSITDLKLALRVGNTYTIKLGQDSSNSYYYLTGQAICTGCDIDSHVGSLARGVFRFKGTGSLT